MNASFIVDGVLVLLGARLWVLRRGRSRPATSAGVLLVVAGLGKIGVGVVPENTDLGLHLLFAANVPITSLGLLLLSLTMRRRELRITGLLVCVLALAATVLSTAAQFVGPSLLLGLGAGGMERLADYPGLVWLAVLGLIALCATDPIHPRNRHALASSPTGDLV